ncbi:alpha-galactosidase [Paenibacillus sp. UNC496MF]|uniref:glycoside hydrolase family 36 protein n=1 Tax=Paenibacillus sp. UNC496MF TaxID=1502753 RepID=UPI0008E761C0|nr:glycoside hydrolase family 36 protein [Paenibacillus sp. UNC496MF]SFJ79378.1 alpha-galactosidase [Paenibacillus sp. UNC496MF]
MHTLTAGLYEYRLDSEASPFRASLRIEREDDGIDIVRLLIEADEPQVPPPFALSWHVPIIDAQGMWHPTANFNKGLRADWAQPFDSKSTYSAPVVSLYAASGRNRMTFAFSDALNAIKFDAGVNEETARFRCLVALFDTPTTPLSRYEAELRVDARDVPYYEALAGVSRWWETYPAYAPAPVPAAALEPMYSTWYSFHQQLTPEGIERQCELSRAIGCDSVIVDDGWQTADNARGYAYCGDWNACAEKIPDMKAHVARVHALGMRYLLWYSVPFVGIRSGVWNRFAHKLLDYIERLNTGVLDPRYPEVREYLIGTYERALLEWDLDGFKLDFVDVFRQPAAERGDADPGRDMDSVAQAVDVLLSGVIDRLRAIKPDVMIEFRQAYISPLMRKYGNMFRAGDVPNDALQNRAHTIDVRLLCGHTAAHSDMIMWHPDEPAESAALQLLNILFAVPQISVRLDALPRRHRDMVAFWLRFWREHRDTLMGGDLAPHHPELNYPLVTARGAREFIAAAYHDTVVGLPGGRAETIILVNGTRGGRLVAEAAEEIGPRSVRVLDCCGVEIDTYALDGLKGLRAFDVPASGLVILQA